MVRNGCFADMQSVRYGLVLEALTNEFDYFMFAWRKGSDLSVFRIPCIAPAQQVLKNSLSSQSLNPNAAIRHFANRNRNLLDGPLSLNHAFRSTPQRPFEEIKVLSSCQNNHARFIDFIDKTSQRIKLFLHDVHADEQYIWGVLAHCIYQPVPILAFRQHLNVGMIRHCLPQSGERERLIIGNYDLNIAHKPPVLDPGQMARPTLPNQKRVELKATQSESMISRKLPARDN